MNNLSEISAEIRKKTLNLCYIHNSSHIGSSFSVIDILTVLYEKILRKNAEEPNDPKRDRVFYSKGHAAAAFYATLDQFGYLKNHNLFEDYSKNGSFFTSHINDKIHGVEISTGSLGHALPIAIGVAISMKRKNEINDIYNGSN